MGTVTGRTKHIEAPDGSGSMEIRALGFLALDEAKAKRLEQLTALVKTMGGMSFPDSANGAAPEPPDPLLGYDKYTLLHHGVTSWSYGEKVNVSDLDGPTAEWAAREILAYSVPNEEELGKGESRSTVTLATLSSIPLQTNGS